jgi:hypothetical protein
MPQQSYPVAQRLQFFAKCQQSVSLLSFTEIQIAVNFVMPRLIAGGGNMVEQI